MGVPLRGGVGSPALFRSGIPCFGIGQRDAPPSPLICPRPVGDSGRFGRLPVTLAALPVIASQPKLPRRRTRRCVVVVESRMHSMPCPRRKRGFRTLPWLLLGQVIGTIPDTACVTRQASFRASGIESTPASGASTGTFLPPASAGAAGLSDIVLIYQGGTDRLPWSPEQLAPYVTARASDGRER